MVDFTFAFLLFLNIVTFCIFGLDKFNAIIHESRIRERTLLLCGIFGGIGGYFAMLFFRHKIRKPKFRVLIPFFAIIDGFLIYFVWTAR